MPEHSIELVAFIAAFVGEIVAQAATEVLAPVREVQLCTSPVARRATKPVAHPPEVRVCCVKVDGINDVVLFLGNGLCVTQRDC